MAPVEADIDLPRLHRSSRSSRDHELFIVVPTNSKVGMTVIGDYLSCASTVKPLATYAACARARFMAASTVRALSESWLTKYARTIPISSSLIGNNVSFLPLVIDKVAYLARNQRSELEASNEARRIALLANPFGLARSRGWLRGG